MRDYRSYENRRRVAARRRNSGGPRALLIGLGIFIVAIAIVGVALLLGGDDQPADASISASDATETSTPPPVPQTPSGLGGDIATQGSGNPTPSPNVPAQASQPTREPTATPDPEPEATEVGEVVPVDEPTAEPTTVDDPTPEPAVGAFGTLPPADIPSGGLGRDLVLTYRLEIGPADIPVEATVYHMLWPEHTTESVAELASRLGIDGNIDGGGGSFSVVGNQGTLTVSGQSIQYRYSGKVPPGSVADDATVIAAASDWLLTHGLVLNDIGPGSVIGRDELGARVSVVFYSTDPETLLSVYPSARLTVGPGPTILEAYVIWPSGYESSVYGLRRLDDLMGDLHAGRAFIEADLSVVPGDGPVVGTMTITSVGLAYSTAGSSATGQFLTPVMVFSGEAVLDESGLTIPVSVYVPAVYAQDTPRG